MARPLVRSQWESKVALLSHLAGGGAHVVVGAHAESPRSFFSFRVLADGIACELGVFSSGLGVDPEIVALGARVVLIGHDDRMTWVDVTECRVSQSHRLSGVFYRFVTLPGECSDVVALHELGLVRVDASGRTVWTVDTDIVEDVRWCEEGLLILRLMGRERALEVDSATGLVTDVRG